MRMTCVPSLLLLYVVVCSSVLAEVLICCRLLMIPAIEIPELYDDEETAEFFQKHFENDPKMTMISKTLVIFIGTQ